MKSTILSIVLAMLGVAANSQVITVTATTLQKFNHSSSMSTIEAMTLDAINYPSYIVGENVFVFDLNNKTMTLNGSIAYDIVEINKNENILDCVIMYETTPILYSMGETTDGQSQFIREWVEGELVYGEFSMNSDFSYTVQ